MLDSGETQGIAFVQSLQGNEPANSQTRKLTNESVGILVCGTGIGMSIAANKVPGIRAALVHTPEEARLAREHNNANVLCFGGRTMQASAVLACIKMFSQATFAGERHTRRIEKLGKMTRHGYGCVN